jgi:ferrous iron transport protein A
MTFKHITHSCCHFAGKVRSCLAGPDCHGQMGPLSQQHRSGRLKICKITGDRKLCARMASMGVYPGIEAELICPENDGRCVLKIQNGTVCLDATVTENILVTAV